MLEREVRKREKQAAILSCLSIVEAERRELVSSWDCNGLPTP